MVFAYFCNLKEIQIYAPLAVECEVGMMKSMAVVIAGLMISVTGGGATAAPVPEIPRFRVPPDEIPSIRDATKSETAPIPVVPSPILPPVEKKPDPRCESLTPGQRLETPGCN
jgi:hypothetical protein